MYSIMTGEDVCRSNLLGAVSQNTMVAGSTAGSASAGTGHLMSTITTGKDVCRSKLRSAVLQNTVVAGNTAGSASAGTGLGGGIFLGDICTGGTCTSVGAILQYVNFTGNYAHLVSSPIYHPYNQCIQNLSMKAVQACRGHRPCMNICTFVSLV